MIVEAIGDYVGGRAALGRLNILIPGASAARDGLCDLLEEAGARVDIVTTYRTAGAKQSGANTSQCPARRGRDRLRAFYDLVSFRRVLWN
jgi:uroporphyrinogen-III synthase